MKTKQSKLKRKIQPAELFPTPIWLGPRILKRRTCYLGWEGDSSKATCLVNSKDGSRKQNHLYLVIYFSCGIFSFSHILLPLAPGESLNYSGNIRELVIYGWTLWFSRKWVIISGVGAGEPACWFGWEMQPRWTESTWREGGCVYAELLFFVCFNK